MEPAISDQEHRIYRELLGAFALDAGTPDEMSAVESHLLECESCRSEVSDLRAVVAVLPLTVEDREPPAALRASILTAIGATPASAGEFRSIGAPPERPAPVVDLTSERTWRAWLPWAAAAAMLMISIGLLAWNLSLRDDRDRPEPTTIARSVPTTIATPEPVTIAFEPMDESVQEGAAATYMEDAGVIKVWLTEDPGLGEDEVLQLWMIEPNGDAVPAGIMTEARSPIAVAADPEDFDMLAITKEPGPMGMPSPTSEPILMGKF